MLTSVHTQAHQDQVYFVTKSTTALWQ